METAKFLKLCETVGDPELTKDEAWRTVKYIHTPGQGSPAMDVERMIKEDSIKFVPDQGVFVIKEAPAGDVIIPINTNETMVTAYDLGHITDMSFNIPSDVVDIYDIIEKIKPGIKIPVKISFDMNEAERYDSDNKPVFIFDSAAAVCVKLYMARDLILNTDYTITFTNVKTGLSIDSITDPGEYKMNVTCIGKYVGETYCTVIVEEEEHFEPVYDCVSVNGTTYDSIETALRYAPSGSTISLIKNVEIDDQISITDKNVTINLNGKSIISSGGALYISGGVVNITGGVGTSEGSIIAGSGGTYKTIYAANSAVVNIYGGFFLVGADENGEGNSTIYATTSSIVNIYGGTYKSAAPYNGKYYTLNVNNSNPGKIIVYGGTFENQDPRLGDDKLGGTFVAYEYTVETSTSESGNKYYRVVEYKDDGAVRVSTVESLIGNIEDNSTIRLSTKISTNDAIEIDGVKNLTIDLDGLPIESNGTVFRITNGSIVTIKGAGKVRAGYGAIYHAVDVGENSILNIEDGDFSVGVDANGQGNTTILAESGGTINISGGTYSSDAPYNEKYYVLDLDNTDPGEIVITGGTFKNQDPRLGDDTLGGNYVPEGYTVNAEIDGEDIYYKVSKDA